MKIIAHFWKLALLVVMFVAAAPAMSAPEWSPLKLDRYYEYPVDEIGDDQHVLVFPRTSHSLYPAHAEDPCREKKHTGKRWVSTQIPAFKGLQFRGMTYKEKLGSSENHFAVFFALESCYKDSTEIGWSFKSFTNTPRFYFCALCNAKEQRYKSVDLVGLSADEYSRWRFRLDKDGNVTVRVRNLNTGDVQERLIERPAWFPNIYGQSGYVTMNAAKRADDVNDDTVSYLFVTDLEYLTRQ